jgi:hypothetical protein
MASQGLIHKVKIADTGLTSGALSPGLFDRWRLQNRTAGPPPFSSMNSTPARDLL